jgi:hypothetical protein
VAVVTLTASPVRKDKNSCRPSRLEATDLFDDDDDDDNDDFGGEEVDGLAALQAQLSQPKRARPAAEADNQPSKKSKPNDPALQKRITDFFVKSSPSM